MGVRPQPPRCPQSPARVTATLGAHILALLAVLLLHLPRQPELCAGMGRDPAEPPLPPRPQPRRADRGSAHPGAHGAPRDEQGAAPRKDLKGE